MLAVGAIVVAVDQMTKTLAENGIDRGDRVEVLPFVDFVHVLNKGVAFGFLGSGGQGVVLAVTIAALILVLGWFTTHPDRKGGWLAVGLLAGGAIGNLIDRLTGEGVTDFIDLPLWPSFNVADIAITLGAVLLVLAAFSPRPADES